MVTNWDALGYYMYLPAAFIYHDARHLTWSDSLDRKYGLSGGTGFYQAQREGDHYVFKYLGGVAIIQVPFFAIGHIAARLLHYPQDGFSPPYQYAITYGAILYALLALLVLRRVLLYYFRDITVAIALVLTSLATNLIQYTAIDNAQSHGYIFLLYALVLLFTLRWHLRPRAAFAFAIGYIVGLATICRPTEAIMLFIPILWNTQSKTASSQKWALVRSHRSHVVLAVVGGLLGILPQLLYWKFANGSFLYDVGSKWEFFAPHWQVLFGGNKGWFIYTPITVFFIIGMFFMKKFPFRWPVLVFCLLNIWIIIAWDDWRYGGSYSTRALSQSYPVFALAIAAFIDSVRTTRWRGAFYIVGAYLTTVNLFQLRQYNTGILHYYDMNWKYYSHIYLNPHPSSLDMSLLDTDEWIDEGLFYKTIVYHSDSVKKIHLDSDSSYIVLALPLPEASDFTDPWLRIDAEIVSPNDLWQSSIWAQISSRSSSKTDHIRLYQPVGERTHHYAFYLKMPATEGSSMLTISLHRKEPFDAEVKEVKVVELRK